MRHSGRDSIIVCSLAAVLIAYAAYAAVATPGSLTFTQNTSVNYANSNFSVNWSGSENISNYSIYVFNNSVFVLKATNTSVSGYFFNATVNNGNYTFSISAANETGDESANATSAWIFVDRQNATITLNGPANGMNLTNTSGITFNFTAADNTAINCTPTVDGVQYPPVEAANNTPTTAAMALPEGRHLWNISCTDAANNTNTSATYVLTIDVSSPSITLNSPANSAWDSDGKLNFTFTATDAIKIDNCSLWTNTTGTWHLNMTNNSVVNNTQSTFVFDNTLGNGKYIWNVRCFDNISNAGFSSDNYTFTVGISSDFILTSVILVNSSAAYWNNPVEGSDLLINATINNTGTANSTSNITIAVFLDGRFILQRNESNVTLSTGTSTNLTFNITGGNLTGLGSHNITVSVDYPNTITEINETNNNRSLVILSGLNVSVDLLAGSAIQTPKPGANVSLNITVLYQNGSVVTGLVSSNFTIYDVYTYENGTVVTSRTIPINSINGSQNESGIYSINATSPLKNAANRAEYGNHTIRVRVFDNKSIAYYGEDNRTSNYYTMQAPNLVISFYASSYDIDMISQRSANTSIRVKNTGIINITDINLSISTDLADLTLLYNSTYVRIMPCNYTSIVSANASSTFITVPLCDIRYNTTKNGTYVITARASGRGPDNEIYNATEINQTIYVVNSSNTGSSSLSSSSDGSASLTSVKKYNYTIDITNYAKTILIEQGGRSNTTLAIKNKGNGTIHNISVRLTTPATVSWGKWYNSTKIYAIYPGQTANIEINMSVSSNTTISTYTIIANASGDETGSSKNITFLIQVVPGNETKEQITISFTEIMAQIDGLNKTLSELFHNADNENLTLASKKLSEAIRLKLEAEKAMLAGDYLTAYNNKKDIEAMLPEIKDLLITETKAVQKKQGMQTTVMIIALIIIALAGAVYYLWLPDEGYVPGKGYFKKNPIPQLVRIKDALYLMMHKSARSPANMVKEMMNEDKQDTKLFKLKEQPYNYSSKNDGSAFSLSKMSQNLVDQFKEHKQQTNGKPNYDFHKKQRWSND